jgi:hypothetical protein
MVLGCIDDLVTITEQATHQRNMAITLSGSRYNLCLSAIGVHDVIAFLRGTYLLTVIQLELHRRSCVLNDSAVAGLAALRCDAVNSDRRVSFDVLLPLLDYRQHVFVAGIWCSLCQSRFV